MLTLIVRLNLKYTHLCFSASDSVKRMFTFDFLGRRFAQKYIKESMIASVRNHEYDDDSLEAISMFHNVPILTRK